MGPDPSRDFRLTEAALQEPRRSHASPLELDAIELDPGWMSHAEQSTRFTCHCHYVL